MDWLSLGATALGGLLGSKAGGDQQQTATATKDPWAPAQPYMLDNLKNEASLQKYYQATPFNQQQTEGYSNLFGDIGNFRNNVMPGLMDFANNGMTSSYQRQSGGTPGSGGGYGGAVQPGGMRQAGKGPFSVNQGAQQGVNGLLDLNGTMNPHANGAIKAPATAAAQPSFMGGGLMGGDTSGGSGNGAGGGGSSSASTGSLAQQQMALSMLGLDPSMALKLGSPVMAAIMAAAKQMGGSMADTQMGYIGGDMNSLNAAAAAGGIPGTGMGSYSDADGNVRSFSSPETLAAFDAATFGGTDGGRGSGNGYGNQGNGGYGGSTGGYGGSYGSGSVGGF